MTDETRSPADDQYPPRPLHLSGGNCPFGRFVRERRSWLDLIKQSVYLKKLVRFRIWPFSIIYVINDPPEVRRVMDDIAAFPKGPMRMWDLMRPVVGDSVANTNGRTWERIRRMIDPAFAQMRMKIVFPLMRDTVDEMLVRVDATVAGGVLDVDHEATHVTGDIILRIILSQAISVEDSRRIFASFEAVTAALSTPAMLSLLRLPEWLHRFMVMRRSRRDARVIRQLLSELIRPRFEARRTGDPGPWQDILAGLLEARDEHGCGFSFEEVVDQVGMLFLAGHETSASALAWATWLLASHPEIQERVAQEVAREVGSRPFEHSDLKRLPLTLDVYRETLRLYPPVGFLPREAAVDTSVRSEKVAAGCPVLVLPWVIHRHRKLWHEPDAFDPDRFRRGEDDEAIAKAYLPFGLGPRACLGAAIALQEGVLVLASLVRAYRFTAIPGERPTPYARVTVRSEKPIRVAIAKR